MAKMKKELMVYSLIILLFVGLSLVRSIVDAAVTQFAVTSIPEGVTKEIAQIMLIVAWAIGIVALLPLVFIGLRGLKASKEKVEKRGHITWAIVLFVFNVISVITLISNFFQPNVSIVNNILSLIICLVDVVVLFMYIKLASKVHKADNRIE